MSLSSYLTCNLVPRRGVTAVDPYDGPQPQTATCCTALQRGFAPDGLAQPRYAPLRTPGSAALLQQEQPGAEQMAMIEENGGGGADGDKAITTSTPTKKKKATMLTKVVRKCKSTVEHVDVSQLIEGPRLRRSGAVRRDWSFEDLRADSNAA